MSVDVVVPAKGKPGRPRKPQLKNRKPGQPMEPPDVPDTNRCMAWTDKGDRCALDVGHYRGRTELKPCPHITEEGLEWFGNGRSPVYVR